MTKPYKRGKRLFMYDEENAIVYYVSKMTAEDKRENEEWKEEHKGKPLYETDPTGEYMLVDGVGLRRENWNNKEARDGYLAEWCYDMETEMAYMIDDLKKEFGL